MSLERSVREYYLLEHPVSAARILEQSPDTLANMTDLSTESLSKLCEHIDSFHLKTLFQSLDTQRQADVLQSISVRTILHLLGALGEKGCEKLFDQLPKTLVDALQKLQSFPPGSAGSYMNQITTYFRPDQTVSEVLSVLRDSKAKPVRSLHLTDADGRLTGRVDLQDMALSEPDTDMADLMHPVDAVAELTSTESDLVEQFDRYRVNAVPVVDANRKLLGLVHHSSLVGAVEDIATTSIQRMVGVSDEERALSSVGFVVKRRLVWLHINLLTAFLAAFVVGLFESTIAQFTVLAILLPVVAGQSGNAGAQALAVTMRGLSLKEISIWQWPQVLGKELMVGMVDGCMLAVSCGLGVYIWSASTGLAIVIAIAMVTAITVACMAGALVPIVLVRLGQDPATASTIVLTTITDVSGFLAFLGTATLLSAML
ncbi:MAG: magnesium transporter [Gammaproteobacteria bacterium]